MTRYLINPQHATGQAELWYSDTGILLRIDVSKAHFAAQHRLLDFKNSVPIQAATLVQAMQDVATTITEGEITVTFEQWWKRYNHKINKARCIPLFGKLSNAEQIKAYTGIDRYEAFLKKEQFRNKLDPENYLRNKTWENEYK
jgi:hypothetical protein